MSADEETTQPPAQPREKKGKETLMLEKEERQDERTDRFADKAIEAAEKGRASAERTVKMLYLLLAAALLAVVVLVAMVLDAKLSVSHDGVEVGGPSVPISTPERAPATD